MNTNLSDINDQPIKPVWITVKNAGILTSLSKPAIYDLMNSGVIKNFSLRERGKIKGSRRILLESLLDFLESKSSGGNASA